MTSVSKNDYLRSIGVSAIKPTARVFKFVGLFILGMLAKMAGPALAYVTIFTGSDFLSYLPTQTVGELCFPMP